MKTTSKILALLLSVCLMMSMTPLAVFAEEQPPDSQSIGASGDVATTTDAVTDPEALAAAGEIGTRAVTSITIGEEQVADVSEDQTGTGWSWTASSRTLTLNDYNGGRININCASTDTIKLVLTGDSTVVSSDDAIDAIYCAGILEITSSAAGKLTATSDRNGVNSIGSITISGDATVNATGNNAGINSSGNITISGNAIVSATAETGSGIQNIARTFSVYILDNAQ